jgi:RimJ/RimL family protein N-acetyltransferase
MASDSVALFQSMLREVKFLAEVRSSNDASLRIFKRCGFAFEEKKTGWNVLA